MNGETIAKLLQLPIAEYWLNYKYYQSVDKLLKWEIKNRSDYSRIKLLKENKMLKIVQTF